MIVNETDIQQMTVEFKLLQVPLWLFIMNNGVHTITGAVKGPKNTNYS